MSVLDRKLLREARSSLGLLLAITSVIALGVMAGEDALDFRTKGSQASAHAGPYTQFLNRNALKGKRFGVPAFIVAEAAGGRGVFRGARDA